MTRLEVIQRIIDRKKGYSYLEIGIHDGKNFFRIKAKKKTAVDPKFIFSNAIKLKWCFKNFHNFFAKYYEITSDSYFSKADVKDAFDVVFVDGLHTYDQSKRDVLNSLERLNENGVIVMHDCNPQHYAAAYPAKSLEQAINLNLPGWDGNWQGDVWKTICFLRSARKDLRVFVLDCDCGMGIITRGKSEGGLDLSEEDLTKMTFENFEENRKILLNLQDTSYLSQFLDRL